MKLIPRWLYPVVVLVLIFLVASAVIYRMGVSASGRVETNGAVVQVAGKARLEWQKLMRGLYKLKFGDEAQQREAIGEVAQASNAFGQCAKALIDGGPVDMTRNFSIDIPNNALNEQNRQIASELQSMFEDVNARLAPAIAISQPDNVKINTAFEYANTQDVQISALTSRLVGMISLDSFASISRLDTLRLIATSVGVLFIGLLIALYSRQLMKLGRLQKETDEIFQTVPTGLFLLDRNLKLGDQHSAQLSKIIGQTDIAGKDFSAVFGKMIDADTLSTARDFLGLLIGDQVDESLVKDVNPLDRIDAVISNDSGRPENRHLGFSFRRVVQGSKLQHLMVSVSDITEQVKLSDQVSRLEKQLDGSSASTIELVSSLLSVERPVLRDRLKRYEQLLDEANGHLKDSGRNNVTYQNLVAQVFRPLHTLKGETAALGLKMLANGAEDVEAELSSLRGRTEISGNDFLGVTLKLDELYDRLGKLNQLVNKLPEPKVLVAPAGALAQSGMSRAAISSPNAGARFDFTLIQQACERTADKLGKKIVIQGQNFSTATVPDALKATVTDVLMQLVRNALAHGIETPESRRQLGKPEAGKIITAWQAVDGGFDLLFRDDGAGLNFDMIRQRGVQLGKFSSEQAAALDTKQLAGLIFEPGFSTASKANDTAGQGVGLDVVMAAVKRANGKIAVGTQPGAYTQFRVRFPA